MIAGAVISRGQHIAFAPLLGRHRPHPENREISCISLATPLGFSAFGCTTEPHLAPDVEPILQIQIAQQFTKRVRQRSAFAASMNPDVTRQRNFPPRSSSWSSEHDFAPQQTETLAEIERDSPVLGNLIIASI